MSWCETEMQKYAIGETECNVFILMSRREIRDGGEGVERGLRWKQDRDREKRDKR